MERGERIVRGADTVGEFEQAVHDAACIDASDEDGGFARVGAGDERDGLGLRHRGGARKWLGEQAVRRRDVNVQRCGGGSSVRCAVVIASRSMPSAYCTGSARSSAELSVMIAMRPEPGAAWASLAEEAAMAAAESLRKERREGYGT